MADGQVVFEVRADNSQLQSDLADAQSLTETAFDSVASSAEISAKAVSDFFGAAFNDIPSLIDSFSSQFSDLIKMISFEDSSVLDGFNLDGDGYVFSVVYEQVNNLSGAVSALITEFDRLDSKIEENSILKLSDDFSSVTDSSVDFAEAFSQNLSSAFDFSSGLFSDFSKYFSDTVKLLSDTTDFIADVFTLNWENSWGNVVEIFKNAFNIIPSFLESTLNNAVGLINKVLDGINNVTGVVGIAEIPEVPNVSLPRFRMGIDYVPSDDYPALLHRGETVLTADEADLYRSIGGSKGISLASVSSADNRELISALKALYDCNDKNSDTNGVNITMNNYSPKALNARDIEKSARELGSRLARK